MRRILLLALLLAALVPRPAAAQFLGPPQNITVVDSGTACVTAPAACASFSTGQATSVGFDVSGTWTGTLTFEQTSNGSTWRTLWVTNAATGVQVSSTTASGSWTVANGGFIGVRLRATNTVTGLAVVTATRGYGVSAHLFDASIITGVLPVVNGGTGFASYAVGDLLYADTTTTLAKRAAVATGQVLASAGTSTAPAYTATPTVTSATASNSALVTASTDGVVLVNTTAATGAVTAQISPRLRWRGTAWDTAASQTVDFFAENLPATAATPTGTWRLGYSLNGGATTFPLTVTSAGTVTTLAGITSGGNIRSGGSFNFGASTALIVNPGCNGCVNLTDSSAAFGVMMQFTALSTITSGFGASPSITTGSTDTAGDINVGTGGSANSGVVAFKQTWSRAPFCVCQDATTGTLSCKAVASTTTLTLSTPVAWTASDHVQWICLGGK